MEPAVASPKDSESGLAVNPPPSVWSDQLRNYALFVRFRLGFATAVVIGFTSATFMGSVIQASSLIVNLEKNTVDHPSLERDIFAFLGIPVLLLTFGVLVDCQIDLVADCCDEGLLPDMKSRCMSLGVPERAFQWCVCLGMELCPLACLLCSDFHMMKLSNLTMALMQGVWLWSGVLTLVLILLVFISLFQRHLSPTASQVRYMKVGNDVEKETLVWKLHDWFGRTTWDIKTGLYMIFAALCLLLLLAIVEFFFAKGNRNLALLNFTLCGLVMYLLRLGIDHIRSFSGPMPRIFMAFFVAANLLSLVINIIKVDMSDKEGEAPIYLIPPSGNKTYYSFGHMNNAYPVCFMRWGNDKTYERQKLTIVDLAIFSLSVYNKGSDVMSLVESATEHTDLHGFELETVAPYDQVGRWGVFRNDKSKVRIIAVRGTHTSQDIITDLDIFGGVALLQAVNTLLPVLATSPDAVIQRAANLFNWRQLLNIEELWMPLLRNASYWQKQSEKDGYSLVITGHSLGGNFAGLVGAQLGIPAVAFSPPGALYSLGRFNQNTKQYYGSMVTVQPEGDVVPTIDRQVGFRQLIRCSVDTVGCHQLWTTLCELYRKCGDTRHRSWNKQILAPRPENHCRVFGLPVLSKEAETAAAPAPQARAATPAAQQHAVAT